MTISISQLRLSFIWATTVPQLFADKSGYWAGDVIQYQAAFDGLQQGKVADVNGATLPWPEKSRQRFWSFYAEALQAQLVGANRAWKLLMPFRLSRPLSGLAAAPDLKLVQEGFLFPHAVGFILGITVELDGTLADAVDKACSIRNDKLFTLNAQPIGVLGVGERALRDLLASVAGPEAVAGMKPVQPFSIVSVTRATGAEALDTVLDGDEIHRALEGFATLNKTWKANNPAPLVQGRTPQGGTQPGEHLLYAAKRGRAVWHPHYFTSEGEEKKPLNCYHRNLCFASIQTQSLLALLDHVTDERGRGKPPTGQLNDYAQRAAGILGRMHGGAESTYRSYTIRRQIEDAGRVLAINAERQFRGMPPLA